MWKPIYPPGPWKAFQDRKDIKGLPIMEARKKYMQEQLLYEGYMNNLNTVNTVNSTTAAPASAAAGGGGNRVRKYKYNDVFELTWKGDGSGVDRDELVMRSGIYSKVAVSDLKKYWNDNFWDDLTQKFSVPPPSLGNLSADYFFIRKVDGGTVVDAYIITWGPFGRGKSKSEWTFAEYRNTSGVEVCGWSGNWRIVGVGSGALNSPVGKYQLTDLTGTGVPKGAPCGKRSARYELLDVESIIS